MTHKSLFALLIALFPVIATSCSDDDDEDLIGHWVRTSDFDGLARGEASCFSIGNKGYLVGGYTGKTRLNDLWEYDMTTDAWTQKSSFPGTARSNGTAFAIDNKGYFGTGYDGTNNLNDFWEYDPASNAWTQKANFPGSGRYDAVSFGVSGKGYIGAGNDGNYLKDFYSFNPSSNAWTQIVSIGGSKRQGASSFVIDNIAYVCGGINNGEYVDDFWKFDPATGQWTQLRDIANTSDEDYDDDYSIVRRGIPDLRGKRRCPQRHLEILSFHRPVGAGARLQRVGTYSSSLFLQRDERLYSNGQKRNLLVRRHLGTASLRL